MPEDQLSIAIGKSGQNVRLASKLTGYELDIEADKGHSDKVPKPLKMPSRPQKARSKPPNCPSSPSSRRRANWKARCWKPSKNTATREN